jgi:hypothetical protein
MKLWKRFPHPKREPPKDDERRDLDEILFFAWQIEKRRERRILFEEHRIRR